MKDFPFPLVVPVDGEARASSEIIANGVGQGHRGLMQLIRSYLDSFEEFGKVQFEMRLNRRGSPTEYAMLNEHQATLLITFMRNSPKVIAFKIALVKEFFRMRDELGRREQTLWQQMQALIAREVESKVRASFGSHLMLARKRELPGLDAERELLESQMQPSLLN
ncbi:Rha family transcriptional regulator [Burkholderia seminalis]|uniref:Rha family transcriptional regulator n=1 Tax=Burkholderia seminalis TaxID=488731 RepID=UPI001905B1E5|nr:Rha family transcriptional regulator [Burkholderia seminalis]MBJ9593243.1 Rha family transcriptional regulator [Burkholderia seminalis]